MAKAKPWKLVHENVNRETLAYAWVLGDEGGGFDLKTSPENTSASAQIHIAWEDLNRARRMLVGYPTIRYEGSIAYISRNLPLFLPPSVASAADVANSPFLACRAITKVEGRGPRPAGPDGFPTYERARLTLQFASTPYHIQPDGDPSILGAIDGPLPKLEDESNTYPNGEFVRFVRRTTDPVDRTVTVPMAVMRFVLEPGDPDYTVGPAFTPGPPLMDAYGVQEPGVDVTFTHYEVPRLPLLTILATMGAVNKTAFSGFPPHTLVMLAPKIRFYRGAAGIDLYDIQHRARYLAKVQAGATEADPVVMKTANHFLRAIKVGDKEYKRV